MDDMHRAFVLADLKRTWGIMHGQEERAQSTAGPTASTSWREKISSQLQSVEENCMRMESLATAVPYATALQGPIWKVFLKRCVRKLTWWFVHPLVVQENGYTALNNSMIHQLQESISLLKEQAVILEAQIQTNADSFREQLDHQGRQIQDLTERFQDFTKPSPRVTDYIDYTAFEEKFRGSQEAIRSRICRYLQYFSSGSRVVDLGCGRGEWLELLESIGAVAVGVDLNETVLEICRAKGLQVAHEDIFAYLKRQPDGSLDGITAIQVIEHLTPVELAQLVQLCFCKLALGGHLIFETQNPAVVSTMTNNFYIDPTHIRPVHPQWAKYLLESVGFSKVVLDYPEYAWVTDGSLPPIHIPGEDTAAFNSKIAYLNNLLYGSTDYAVVCIKETTK